MKLEDKKKKIPNPIPILFYDLLLSLLNLCHSKIYQTRKLVSYVIRRNKKDFSQSYSNFIL